MNAANGKRRPLTTDGATNPGKEINTVTVPRGTDIAGLTREKFAHWHDWLADSYDIPRERLGYAVLVHTRNGDVRRRLYLSLDSAYRAIERAELRGVEAHAVLVELRQVGEVR